MMNKQKGFTLISMLSIALLACFFSLAVIRIFPIYLTHYKVIDTIKSTKNEINESSDRELMNFVVLRQLLQKKFEINNIRNLRVSDLRISREKFSYKVQAKYEERVKLFANIDVVVKFDSTTMVPLHVS